MERDVSYSGHVGSGIPSACHINKATLSVSPAVSLLVSQNLARSPILSILLLLNLDKNTAEKMEFP